MFIHVIYKGLLRSVAHIHFERELCSCSSVVARFSLVGPHFVTIVTCYYLVALIVFDYLL